MEEGLTTPVAAGHPDATQTLGMTWRGANVSRNHLAGHISRLLEQLPQAVQFVVGLSGLVSQQFFCLIQTSEVM